MPCPDDLNLDLWLNGALSPSEAAAVAAHLSGCAACAAAVEAARAHDVGLRTALALDADERAFLSTLDLAGRWRARPAVAPTWGWVLLVGAVSGYLGWLATAPPIASLVAVAIPLGLAIAPLPYVLGSLFDLGQGLADLARHPVIGLGQPLLALVALTLLLWPDQLIRQRRTRA